MKKGEKYIIEIGEVEYFGDDNGVNYPLARIKGFSTLVFDERGLNKLKKVDEETAIKGTLNCKFVVATDVKNLFLTKGRIYEVINGKFTDDIGLICPINDAFSSFASLTNYLKKECGNNEIIVVKVWEY